MKAEMFTVDELRDATHQIFDATVETCKKGTDIQPGFWYATSPSDLSFVSFTPVISQLLCSGEGKAKLFALVRIWIEALGAVAVWMVTDTWQFEQDLDKPLTEAEYRSKVDLGFKRLVAEGYGKVYQSVMVAGMTPERYYHMTRKYESINFNGQHKLIFHGEPVIMDMPYPKFVGRLRMFGKFTEEEVEFYYNAFKTQSDIIQKWTESLKTDGAAG